MTSLAPRTHVKVVYEGVDISKDVSKDLLSISYVDNDGGKADDISLVLKNDHGLWSGPWKPTKGDSISATIITEDDSGVKRLNCGTCQIDKLKLAGHPSTFEIGGVSVPSVTTIRRTQKSRAWENVRLSEICADIAKNGELELVFQPNPEGAPFDNRDPLYDRRDQRDESDLAFLNRLCTDEGFSLKVTDQQLVVYDQEIMSYQGPVFTFVLGTDWVLSYDFEEGLIETYKKAVVEYNDPSEGVLNKLEYEDPSIERGQTVKIVRRTESIEEAERIAKAELKKRNRKKVTCNLTVVGRTDLVSGSTVYLSGFGAFDGKYYVQKSEHRVQNGYTVSLELTFVGG